MSLQTTNVEVKFHRTALKSYRARIPYQSRITLPIPTKANPDFTLIMRSSFLILSLTALAFAFAADADVTRYNTISIVLLFTHQLATSSAGSSSIVAIPDATSSAAITSAASTTGSEVHSTASASSNSTSTAKKNGVGAATGEGSGIAALVVGVAAWLA
jgi:hypothetical protein